MIKQKYYLVIFFSLFISYPIYAFIPPGCEDAECRSQQENKKEFTLETFKEIAKNSHSYFALLPLDMRSVVWQYIENEKKAGYVPHGTWYGFRGPP